MDDEWTLAYREGYERCHEDFAMRDTDKDYQFINPYRAGCDEYDGYEAAIKVLKEKPVD